MKNVIIILTVFINVSLGIAQNSVVALSRANETGINLRWAPTSSVVWELANKYGYTLERYTIIVDGQRVTPDEYNLLVSTFQPAEESVWESLIDQNDYAGIVAQAIYGETFELTDNFDKDIFQVAQKTQERDQRFSFSLFACDQSFQVAKLAGLGYTDEAVKSGEKYLYKIYANIPSTTLKVDTAFVYVGIEDVAPLPQIQDFKATFGDRNVILSWDKTLTDRFYNAFWIEKSTDEGDTYNSISDTPIINAYSEGTGETGTYFKLDSLSSNQTETSYRIRGVNPFGELGPFSEPVVGKGVPSINSYATVSSHKVNRNGSVLIEWEFPKKDEKLIEGFIIKVSKKPKGVFKKISEQLTKKDRTHLLENPLGTGYYSIALIANGDEINHSFPYLIQLEDSIPPSRPENVLASVTPNGVVEMEWNENLEDDFLGYRVFRSNFKSAEFSEITTDPLKSPNFRDSLRLDNLSEKIFYKIIAVDKRDNRSVPTDIIEIVKPDIVPPARPVFTNIEGIQTGIVLKWAPSSSQDVVSHQLYRNVRGSKGWELVANVDSINFYLDTAVVESTPYTYTLVAVDDAGLESEPAKPVRGSRKASTKDISYKGFSGRAERENKRVILFWQLSDEEIDKIKVYRSVGDDPINLYKVIDFQDQFVDEKVVQNENYTYQIKAVLKNGLEAGFSEKVKVRY